MKNRSRHKLVVGALVGAAVQALHDIDISTADRIKRSRLVLTVLELALFMGGKRLSGEQSDGFAQTVAGLERKNEHGRVFHPQTLVLILGRFLIGINPT